MYRETSWKNISLHQQVKILKETNQLSINIDPYCCKITINRADRIGDITVGYIPRELSRFVFFFIHEGGSVTGTVASITSRPSPIPEGGLEIPIIMHFVHQNKLISEKMKTFVDEQVNKRTEVFTFEEAEEELEEIEKEEEIIVESGDETDNESCVANENTRTCTELLSIDD